jgi:hypothetical protein
MASIDLAPARSRVGAFTEALAAPRLAGALYAVLTAMMAAPVLLWPIPRGTDLVNHWARLTLYGLSPDDPLRALYKVSFGLIPNLGIDALYLALSPLLSAQSVARLALALSIVLPAWGAWRLHRALFAKPSPTIWFAPLLSYNIVTYIGLVNYGLGVGLGLLALAFVATRGERLTLRDYVALNLIGAVLFFCHLIALAAFGLLFLGLRLGSNPIAGTVRDWPIAMARRAASSAAALAVPLALAALRATPPSTYSLNGSKLLVLFAPVVAKTEWDAAAFVVLLGILFLAVARGVAVAPPARLALVGFGLAVCLAPSNYGAANFIDARLAVFWWYFALATTSLKRPEGLRPYIAGAAICLVAVRFWTVEPEWVRFQQLAGSARQALSVLPRGSKALAVEPAGCGDRQLLEIGALTVFALTDRGAYVNTIFAQSGLQPIAAADPAFDGAPTIVMDDRWLTEAGRAELPSSQTKAPWAGAFADWRHRFTHIIDVHGTCRSNIADMGLVRLGGAAGLDVYAIP